MCSFGWDPNLNSGAGGWKTPIYSHEIVDTEGSDTTFGWDWVRNIRNNMLTACDNRVPADAANTAFAQTWKDYRQKLRDLPADWVGVGTATHLIVWPRDPDMVVKDAEIKGYKEANLAETDPNFYDGVLPGENPDA